MSLVRFETKLSRTELGNIVYSSCTQYYLMISVRIIILKQSIKQKVIRMILAHFSVRYLSIYVMFLGL